MYEGQRKRSNTVVNNEIGLSNAKDDISIGRANEEIESQSDSGTGMVEYVRWTTFSFKYTQS